MRLQAVLVCAALSAVLHLGVLSQDTDVPEPLISISGDDIIEEGEKRTIICNVTNFLVGPTGGTLTLAINNGTTALATMLDLLEAESVASKVLEKKDQVISRQEDNGGDLHCTATWKSSTYQAYLRNQQNITVHYRPYTSSLSVRRLGYSTTPHVAMITCQVSPSNPVVETSWVLTWQDQVMSDRTTVESTYDDLSAASSIIVTDEDDMANITCRLRYSSYYYVEENLSELSKDVIVDIRGLPFPALKLAAMVTGESTVSLTWRAGEDIRGTTWHITLYQEGNTTSIAEYTEERLWHELTDLDAEKEYTVEVYGTNNIGTSETVQTAFILAKPEASSPAIIIVGVVLGVIILILIVVILIIVLRRKGPMEMPAIAKKKKKEKKSKSRGPLPATPTTEPPASARYTSEPTATSTAAPRQASTVRPQSQVSQAEYAEFDDDEFEEDYLEPRDSMLQEYDDVTSGASKPLASKQGAQQETYQNTAFHGGKSTPSSGAIPRTTSLQPGSTAASSLQPRSTAGLSLQPQSAVRVSAAESEEYEELGDAEDSPKVAARVRALAMPSAGGVPCVSSDSMGQLSTTPIHHGAFTVINGVQGMDGRTTQVAKMLKQTAKESESLMFLASIEALRLAGKHDNIVKAVGCIIEHKPRYILMEKAEHKDLLSYLQTKKTIRHDDYKLFASGILKGLIYLHQLKPSLLMLCLNCRHVMLTMQLTCQLSNFGTQEHVKAWHKYCTQNQKHAAMRWCAPETLGSSDYPHDANSDAWSFGLLLYQLFANGKALPFVSVKDKDIVATSKKQELELDYNRIDKKLASMVKDLVKVQPEKRKKLNTVLNLIDGYFG